MLAEEDHLALRIGEARIVVARGAVQSPVEDRQGHVDRSRNYARFTSVLRAAGVDEQGAPADGGVGGHGREAIEARPRSVQQLGDRG